MTWKPVVTEGDLDSDPPASASPALGLQARTPCLGLCGIRYQIQGFKNYALKFYVYKCSACVVCYVHTMCVPVIQGETIKGCCQVL